MDWLRGAWSEIVALDNLGKALLFAILMALGSLASLVVAWRKGYFRSHGDIVRQQRAVAEDIAEVRRDVAKLEHDLAALHGRFDVLAVDQAGIRPVLQELQHQVSEMSRTARRMATELARVGGTSDTLLQMMQREPASADGTRALGMLDETPDPDRRGD